MGDDLRQHTKFLGIIHVGSMNNHTWHSPENCLLYATLHKCFPWSDCVGCIYERKRLAMTDYVGCTYDWKYFRLYNCTFSTTVRISIFECSLVAHNLILPSMCARRAYPRWFLVRVGRTPLSPTLTRWRFRMPSRKGVENHLYSTDVYRWFDLVVANM